MPFRPPTHDARCRAAPPAVPAEAPAPQPKRHESRASAAKRGYGRKWQQARAGYLIRHPLCVHCLAEGHVTGATEVDHIEPHRGDMVKFWQTELWQSLCTSCHSKKTVREDGGLGRQRKVR